MTTHLLLVLSLGLFSLLSWAKPAPKAMVDDRASLRISSESRSSSENLSLSAVRLSALSDDSKSEGVSAAPIYFGLNAAYQWGLIQTQEYKILSAHPLIGWRLLAGLRIEASAGVSHLDIAQVFVSEDHFFRRGAILIEPWNDVQTEIFVKDDLFFQDHFQSGVLLVPLKANTYGMRVDWRLFSRLKFLGLYHVSTVSDSNEMNLSRGKISYVGVDGILWAAAGIQSSSLNFRNRTNSYWSPGTYTSVGPVVEATWTLTESYAVGGIYELSKVQEDSYPSAQVSSYQAYLQLNQDSGIGFRVGYQTTQERHNDQNYSVNQLIIGASGEF